MKKLLITALLALGLSSGVALGQATVQDGKFYFNGERQELVWGRTSFKLANIITHHYTGQGGGKYGLGYALSWVHHNQSIFGENVVLRVFLETAGWSPCDDYDGTPQNCMFGSEPRDQGFWNRSLLRDGVREKSMHPVGDKVLEWFFKTSHETGVAFELVIDATLKHDDIPAGEIDHVIRQVGVRMGELQQQYPRALIIPNVRNEWDAHNQSGHTLRDVNMWVVRWDRDNYTPGWYAPVIVDHGGKNTFDYDVGPEPGKYRAGMIHPERSGGWEQFPNRTEMNRLRRDARGMPVGSTESMYYVEIEDRPRATTWYRPAGWTTNWTMYRTHLENLEAAGMDYIIIHDEKGVQCDPLWPRAETRLEAWARAKFGGITPCEELPECEGSGGTWVDEICDCVCLEGCIFIEDKGCECPTPPSPFEHLLNDMYNRILLRDIDPTGLEIYTEWLAQCYGHTKYTSPCHVLVEDALINSDEYKNKFGWLEIPCEPPEPCNGTWDVEKCECIQDPNQPVPEDYLNLTRARALDCELSNDRECSGNRLQAVTWRGWRDFQDCANNCPNEVPDVFGMTADDMWEFGAEGSRLVGEGRTKFEGKLSTENRRCPEKEEFCGKSNVRKTVWKDYNTRLTTHEEETDEIYKSLLGQPGYGSAYDSVAGWCRYIKANP